jgi:hypothetical protein
LNIAEWRKVHAEAMAQKPGGGMEKAERAFYEAGGTLSVIVRRFYGDHGMDELLKKKPAGEEVKEEVAEAVRDFREKAMRIKYLY